MHWHEATFSLGFYEVSVIGLTYFGPYPIQNYINHSHDCVAWISMIHTHIHLKTIKEQRLLLKRKLKKKRVPALVLEFSQWLVYVCPYIHVIKHMITNMSVKPHLIIL